MLACVYMPCYCLHDKDFRLSGSHAWEGLRLRGLACDSGGAAAEGAPEGHPGLGGQGHPVHPGAPAPQVPERCGPAAGEASPLSCPEGELLIGLSMLSCLAAGSQEL